MRYLTALACCLVACESNAPVPPQVQPTVIPKSLLESDRGWYFQKSIIEIPYNMPQRNDVAPFPTPVMPTAKVRLELQQSWLVGYRVPVVLSGDTDSAAIANQQQIEFAFPVTHVDVVQNQVIDSPVRPWWERSHVIVDWSYPALEGKGYVDVTPDLLEPERWLVTDPADPDRPIFEDGRVDVVVRGRIKSTALEGPPVDLAYWCGDRDAPNCTGTRISWRISMRKVQPPTFEPTPVDDAWSIATFPVFKTAEKYYSDHYGYTDAAKRSLGFHFNLYQTAFDENGNRLPTYQRTLRQRAVHLSPNFPREGAGEVVSSVQTAIDRWNGALRDAAHSRRLSDCQRAGRTDCATLLGGDTSWNFFVLCHTNPVTADEAGRVPLCGPEGKLVRLGDMTDFLIYWSDLPALRAPAAFAYWNPDFSTGELLGALIYFNASLIDRTVMQVVDGIRLSNGDAQFRLGYQSGQETWDWVVDRRLLSSTAFDWGTALSKEVARQASRPTPWTPAVPLRPDEIAEQVRRPDFSWLANPRALWAPPASWKDVDLGAVLQPVVDRLSRESREIDARRAALRGSALERAIMTPETLMRADLAANASLTPEVLEQASPLREAWWLQPSKPTDTHAIDAYFYEPDVEELAKQYVGWDVMDIHNDLRKQMIDFVGTHEFGHTLGLRHNFAGSFDAFNYDDQYWRLRNDGLMGPRYSDPVSTAEREARIDQYANSTVMDYLPQFIYGLPGVGKTDRAAIKWLYGSMVEVLDGSKNRTADVARMANELVQLNRRMGSPPPLIVPANMPGRYSLHYTELPGVFDLANRTDVPLEDLRNSYGNPELDGRSGATATADGRVVAPYMGCSDDVSARMGCDREDLGADPYEIVTYATQRARGNYIFSHYRRALLGFPERRANFPGLAMTAVQHAAAAAAFINALFGGNPAVTAPGEGLETVNVALVTAMDYIGEQLTMPDVGSYAQQPDFAGTPVYRYDPAGPLSLDTDVARHFVTQFYKPTEYTGYLRPEPSLVGWADDKEAALDTLVAGGQLGQTFGISNPVDVRATLVSLYRAFPAQVIDWVGSILTDDFGRYAPAWDAAQSKLVRPKFSQLGWTPGALPRVDPAMPLNIKLRLIAVGFPGLAVNSTNRTFVDQVRVWIAGSGEAVQTTRKVSFADSLTGKTYEAISWPDSGGAETGIAARMLLRATDTQARVIADPNDFVAQETLNDLRYLIETVRTTVTTMEHGATGTTGGAGGGGGAP